jgi:hypothetical protein
MLEVVRLLQAELGWLAFINELGFGSAMVYGTRSWSYRFRVHLERTEPALGTVKSSLTPAGDLNGHRDANNFVGFPTLRQIH